MTGKDIAPLRLGFLYPGHSAEDDLALLAGKLSAPVEAQGRTEISADAGMLFKLAQPG